MNRNNAKQKRQEDCPVAKVINKIAKAASAAEQICRVVEPIVKTVLKSETKTK